MLALAINSQTIHPDALDSNLSTQLQRAIIHSSIASYGDSLSVEVAVTVDEHGSVISAHALSGPRRLFARAEAAEIALHFRPISRGGHPTRTTFQDLVTVLPPERWRAPRVPLPVVHHPKNVVFSIERRRGCAVDPRCLLYAVEINPDRVVHFSEGRFASRSPRHLEASISAENYAKLLTEFRIADFYSMEDQYDGPITDSDGIRISITLDGLTRTVETYAGRLAGAPDAFYRLAARFDELAGTGKWIRRSVPH